MLEIHNRKIYLELMNASIVYSEISIKHVLTFVRKNKDKTDTNVLQTADRGLGEMAYDVSHATALLLLYIEIVATVSQLVDTLLYLYKI